MSSNGWPLKYPITRRLKAHDNTRRKRPFFIRLDPEGVITLWPRRCAKAEISVLDVYIISTLRAKAEKKEAKRREAGKPVRVKRGLLTRKAAL